MNGPVSGTRPGVGIGEIDHLGIVVSDIERATGQYSTVFDVGRWEIRELEPPRLTEATYRGEKNGHTMVTAWAEVGGVGLELVQPRAGENTLTAHLDEHGAGFHHVAYKDFDDPRAAVDRLRAAGHPVVQSGTVGGLEYWYLDTRDVLGGLLFETAANVDKLPDPDSVMEYPARGTDR